MDIFNTEYTQAEGARNGVMEDNLRKDREIAQLQRDNFRTAHEAGAKMVFATDAGVMPDGKAGGEFRVMTESGMTPMEENQAWTRNAAQARGWDASGGGSAVGPERYRLARDEHARPNVHDPADADV